MRPCSAKLKVQPLDLLTDTACLSNNEAAASLVGQRGLQHSLHSSHRDRGASVCRAA